MTNSSRFAAHVPVAAAVAVAVLAASVLACNSQSTLAPGPDAAALDVPVALDLGGDRSIDEGDPSLDSAPFVSCFGPGPDPTPTAKIAAGDSPPPPPGAPTPLPGSNPWGDPRTLPSTELAERLSQFLWRVPADDALRAKVAACPNITRADLAVLVRQMLADDRAVIGLRAFFSWWLDLDRIKSVKPDPTLFPDVTPELLASMAEEPGRFGVDVVRGADPSLGSLLASSFSIVDGRLAALYRLPDIGPSSPFQKVKFNTASLRAGVLTMPGVLALGATPTHNAPSTRAQRVLERVLCRPIPPPPPLPGHDQVPEPPPGKTWRQALEENLGQSPACASCHTFLKLGFGYENFDPLGRLRDRDNGAAIDASGTLLLDSATTSFFGPVALALLLSAAPETAECFAHQWLAFALGLPSQLELNDQQRAALAPVVQVFRSQGLDIRELIATLTGTASFLGVGAR